MNIRLLLGAIAIAIILSTTGCTNAERAKWGSLGGRHKITLYSGGVAVRVWHSTGYIKNEEHSDGYYFEDDTTHKLVTISGEVAIEQE